MASLLFARDCECDYHWLTEGPALTSHVMDWILELEAQSSLKKLPRGRVSHVQCRLRPELCSVKQLCTSVSLGFRNDNGKRDGWQIWTREIKEIFLFKGTERGRRSKKGILI